MKKNKIGIITINDNANYGNRLQNLAVQMVMSKYGEVENIAKRFPSIKEHLKYLFWKASFKKLKYILKGKSYKKLNFYDFNKHIKYSGISVDQIKNYEEQYQLFIYGSDQIWNPFYEQWYAIKPYTSKVKNVALSASIGIDYIPDQYKEEFKKGLNSFRKISVREDSAADIVEDYVGDRPPVLIDPTMMIERTEWEKFERKPKFIDQKEYILIYVLGNLSETRKKKINSLADKMNVRIINLNEKDISDQMSPGEFLYLIHHAKLVITDSFHAVVFSILYRVNFNVLTREDNQASMNSRIITLLNKFKLEDRLTDEIKDWDKTYNHKEIDEILKSERIKAETFLNEVVNTTIS